jgi:hypothetical protein
MVEVTGDIGAGMTVSGRGMPVRRVNVTPSGVVEIDTL